MTRETKIGMVVAGSFLVLVGAVVTFKFGGRNDPSKDPEQQENKGVVQPKVNPDDGKGRPSAKAGEGGVFSAKLASAADSIQFRPVAKFDPNAGQGSDPLHPVLKKQVELSKDKGPLIPPPTWNTGDDKDKPLPPFQPLADKDKPLTLPRDLLGEQKDKPLPNLDQIFGDKKDKPLPSLDQIFGDKPLPPLQDAKDKPQPKFDLAFGDQKDKPPGLPPIRDEKTQQSGLTLPGDPKQPLIPPMTNKDQPLFPGSKELPGFQPLGDKLPKKDLIPSEPLPVLPKNEQKPIIGLTPPVDGQNPKTIPPVKGDDLPSLPGISTKPPVQPVEHRMEFTQAMPGETTFAAISKRLYGHEKYGDALFAYNRAHQTILKDPAGVSANPSTGQKLLYPTAAEILVREFPTLVSETPTIPVTGGLANPAVKLAPPPVAITPPNTSVPVSTANPGGTYVVQTPGGEPIRAIAQRLLGNADRWTEIYRLNQSLNLQPQFPIPAGTKLTMPGN